MAFKLSETLFASEFFRVKIFTVLLPFDSTSSLATKALSLATFFWLPTSKIPLILLSTKTFTFSLSTLSLKIDAAMAMRLA